MAKNPKGGRARKSTAPQRPSPTRPFTGDGDGDGDGTVSIHPLTHRAFPELADAMRPRIEQIIADWMGLARIAVPSARKLTTEELRDNLPNILWGMIDALGSSEPAQVDDLKDESPAQGIVRYQQRYQIKELMTEDRLLRRMIITHAQEGLERPMTGEEHIALNTAVDLMLQEAVLAFVNHQNAQLRSAAESEIKHLSFLSHDLNNNLGTVTLWLQVLRTQLANSSVFAEAVETLDTAQQAILNTIGGMGRLLQAERLRRQGVKPKLVPVELRALVHDVVLPHAALAERKGLRVVIDVAGGENVVSDRELIALVLQNLIGNAVKYSSRGTVSISCRKHDGDDACVITVSDEGPGIAPDQVEKIFEAFTRGQTYGQSGIGLGLTIASQAAKLLGAELRVESKVGKGSRFSLSLPPA